MTASCRALPLARSCTRPNLWTHSVRFCVRFVTVQRRECCALSAHVVVVVAGRLLLCLCALQMVDTEGQRCTRRLLRFKMLLSALTVLCDLHWTPS
jgi:hypothetical protein